MCLPGCAEAVSRSLSRRSFLTAIGGAAGTAISVSGCSVLQGQSSPAHTAKTLNYNRVVDLTHALSRSFPTFDGKPLLELKRHSSLKKDGYNTFTWNLFEHIGTHIDAPIHFSDSGYTVEKIPVTDLVAPLAIIDIRQKAAGNADSAVVVEDIVKWESANGTLHEDCAVAMLSGWDEFVVTPKFRNADESGGLHFPGFHPEAADFLIRERRVKGILVDTLSLDCGNSKDFKTHSTWLSTNRWGVECVANLASLPASGATIVVGAPAIEGATGGPSRIMAFV